MTTNKSKIDFLTFSATKIKGFSIVIFFFLCGACVSGLIQYGYQDFFFDSLFVFIIFAGLINLYFILKYQKIDINIIESQQLASFDYSYAPKVCIIVTAITESTQKIRETLVAINEIQYPNFEVLVFCPNVNDEITQLTNHFGYNLAKNLISKKHFVSDHEFEFILKLDSGQLPEYNILQVTVGYLLNNNCSAVQLPVLPIITNNTTILTKACFAYNCQAICIWNNLFRSLENTKLQSSSCIYSINSKISHTHYLPINLVHSESAKSQSYFGLGNILGWSKLESLVFLLAWAIYIKNGTLDIFFVISICGFVIFSSLFRKLYLNHDTKISIFADYIGIYSVLSNVTKKLLIKANIWYPLHNIRIVLCSVFVTALSFAFINLIWNWKMFVSLDSIIPSVCLTFVLVWNFLFLISLIENKLSPNGEQELSDLTSKLTYWTNNHRKSQLH
jgi:hypothetical protein